MKGKRTLASIPDQTSEMWENGCTSPQISDLIAKEVGNIDCESPTSNRFVINSRGIDSSCTGGVNLWDELASTLVRLGSNPYHGNRYGISYADVRRALYSLLMEHTIRVGPGMYSIGSVNASELLKRQIIEARILPLVSLDDVNLPLHGLP